MSITKPTTGVLVGWGLLLGACCALARDWPQWRGPGRNNTADFTAAASSPLIADGKCIAYLGGQVKGAMTAFDLANGTAKWTWTGEPPSYGSPALLTVEGTPQIVTLTEYSLVGIGLADGKLLWKVPF